MGSRCIRELRFSITVEHGKKVVFWACVSNSYNRSIVTVFPGWNIGQSVRLGI